ncbi:MAG: amidase [Acidimicrobiales bacterium]
MSTELPDATALAAAIAAGELSPLEAVDAAIARIEAVDPALNAVIHRRVEAARAEAAGELPDGPFRGVPLLLKDLGAAMAGEPMHCGLGVAKAAGHRAEVDNAVVRRLRGAGFVVVGRTNVPELGTTVTTEPVAYAPARNPWSTDHSTGGSSGGSAAAVASGMVPAAHATDGGGSIRVPASECALVGLKPSRGRVSHAPDGEAWMGGTTDGVVTRTVRDTAAVLDVLAGPEPGDPYAAAPLPRPLAAEVGADPGRLRIGVLDRPPGSGAAAAAPDAAAGEAARAAATALDELGHHVADAHPAALDDDVEYADRFITIVATNVARDLADWEATLGRPIGEADIEPANVFLRAVGVAVSASDYLAAVDWLYAFSRRVASWWAEGWDLLLTPVLNGPPPPLGWLSDPDEGFGRLQALLAYTSQWNMTGQPAISLPLHWTADGLPVGVQLVAGAGREDLLVEVAAQLEAARPWSSRRPPVWSG